MIRVSQNLAKLKGIYIIWIYLCRYLRPISFFWKGRQIKNKQTKQKEKTTTTTTTTTLVRKKDFCRLESAPQRTSRILGRELNHYTTESFTLFAVKNILYSAFNLALESLREMSFEASRAVLKVRFEENKQVLVVKGVPWNQFIAFKFVTQSRVKIAFNQAIFAGAAKKKTSPDRRLFLTTTAWQIEV